jgi:cell wall-associated NlpC family hydrolase
MRDVAEHGRPSDHRSPTRRRPRHRLAPPPTLLAVVAQAPKIRRTGTAVAVLALSVGAGVLAPTMAGAQLLASGTPDVTDPTAPSSGAPAVTAPAAVRRAPGDADGAAATAIGYALAMLGKPYVWGGADPASGFDCSGLVLRAYAYAGVDLPRTAAQQYAALPHLPIADVQPGDLVFKATDLEDPATIYHVSIYLGGGMVVSAPFTGTVVQVKPVGTANIVPTVVRPGDGDAALLPIPQGSHGWAVTSLQHRLRNNGIPVPVTGSYDAATRDAVSRLRATLGYPDDDYVGQLTWSYLVAHGNQTAVS